MQFKGIIANSDVILAAHKLATIPRYILEQIAIELKLPEAVRAYTEELLSFLDEPYRQLVDRNARYSFDRQ